MCFPSDRVTSPLQGCPPLTCGGGGVSHPVEAAPSPPVPLLLQIRARQPPPGFSPRLLCSAARSPPLSPESPQCETGSGPPRGSKRVTLNASLPDAETSSQAFTTGDAPCCCFPQVLASAEHVWPSLSPPGPSLCPHPGPDSLPLSSC